MKHKCDRRADQDVLNENGKNAKLFITGDLTQIDLPRNQQSGLVKACKILENIKGIDFIFMKKWM